MRQWVHIGFGAAALLLPFLHWYQATILAACAVVFNISLLRRIAGNRLHRPVELAQTIPVGLVLYPTSILLLLLMLPARVDIVAAAWGILAAGDGAATLVGRRYGSGRWPWNRSKSVAGSAALVIAGGAAGAFLCWWCRPVVIPPPYLWFSIGAPIAAAVVAAAVETVPIRLDDNVSVPLTAAAALWAASIVSEDLVAGMISTLPAMLAPGGCGKRRRGVRRLHGSHRVRVGCRGWRDHRHGDIRQRRVAGMDLAARLLSVCRRHLADGTAPQDAAGHR